LVSSFYNLKSLPPRSRLNKKGEERSEENLLLVVKPFSIAFEYSKLFTSLLLIQQNFEENFHLIEV
jgi:hypothetical protein